MHGDTGTFENQCFVFLTSKRSLSGSHNVNNLSVRHTFWGSLNPEVEGLTLKALYILSKLIQLKSGSGTQPSLFNHYLILCSRIKTLQFYDKDGCA